MSIELKKLIDTRIDGNASVSAVHDVTLGGSNIARQTFTSTSVSASNLDFTIQTPGLGVYMSRRVNIEVEIPISFKLTYSASTGMPALVWGTHFGCTAFPFNSLITSGTVQISTSNFTTQVQTSLPMLKRFMSRRQTRQRLGEVATGLGPSALLVKPGDSQFPQPVISMGVNSSECMGPFGNPAAVRWEWTTVAGAPSFAPATNVTTQQTVYGKLIVCEPLLLQPFSTDDEEPAFINTNMITIRCNLSSPGASLARILRFANPTVNAGTYLYKIDDVVLGTGALFEATLRKAVVSCAFITPPPTMKPPIKTLYPTTFYNPLAKSITVASVPQGSVSAEWIYSNVITLNVAPDMIAVYFIPDLINGLDGAGTTAATGNYVGGALEDCLCPIDSLQVMWNNNPSLLATLDSNELWRRTQQNGLPVSWNAHKVDTQVDPTLVPSTTLYPTSWKSATSSGAPVLLALNKDIPVEPGVAAGVAGVYTLQLQVKIKNGMPFALTSGTLVVCPITSQYLVLNAGATSDIISPVCNEKAVIGETVSGSVQSKAMMGAGKNTVEGHMSASSRTRHLPSRLIEALHRAPAVGAALAQAADGYVQQGHKRLRELM
jgi:hypothetical protein